MLLLLVVACAAGLVTVVSPCILPVLPIVLGVSVSGGKLRPLGVIVGLMVSFAIFTLAVAQVVALLGPSAHVLRLVAVAIIAILGLTLLVPALNARVEQLLSRLPGMASTRQRNGWWGGVLTGASLGLVWAPCAGPILAAVTTLAATQQVSTGTALVVVAYVIGAGVPLLGIAYGSRALAQRAARLMRCGGRVQQAFGGLMLATALLMAFNLDVTFTVWATNALPASWTTSLQSFEQSAAVQQQINQLEPASAALPVAGDTNTARPMAPELAGITHWINSDPLTMEALHGKVVLIDFWTYSCINCIRTLPYTTAWYNKYKDQGLIVIGVHSPEFAFEQETANVEDAVKRYGITYPVAQDNQFETWRAYDNQYWPAEYLIDAKGVVRHTHFGEGEYVQTEAIIQQLLRESGAQVNAPLTQIATTLSVDDQTPETYLGGDMQERFVSPQPVHVGKAQQYSIPAVVPLHNFAVGGRWIFQNGFAQTDTNARLQLHFNARDVYLVMINDQAAAVEVQLIGIAQSNNHSEDVDAQNQVIVNRSGLYHVIHLDQVQEGTLELRFSQPGINVYSFTFGG